MKAEKIFKQRQRELKRLYEAHLHDPTKSQWEKQVCSLEYILDFEDRSGYWMGFLSSDEPTTWYRFFGSTEHLDKIEFCCLDDMLYVIEVDRETLNWWQDMWADWAQLGLLDEAMAKVVS